ncbi:MAG: hypothetical protein HC803_04160 [Saprospiraceae bacterium]|nr:hypothetical protein [Saprospiraceae bacterium]
MNPKVDKYFDRIDSWQEELETLRAFILDCGLTEELKWGVPCYTFQNGNVILLGGFKEYCVISFVKGVLLNDSEEILIQQTENSQSVRIIKFTNVQEILDMETVLKSYIYEAVEVEKAGLKVDYKSNDETEFVEELVDRMAEDAAFKTAFEALTPGRQKGYNMFFAAAKQSKTRVSRIEKYTSRIFDGKGMNDCVCGHSKKMPGCDGSHKYL